MDDARQAVLRLAAAQLGCVTIGQAIECGLSRRQVQWGLGSSRFERVGSRVLRAGGAPASWPQALLAGLLDLGDDALVSHRSAAALHGFDGFPQEPIEFTVQRRRRKSESGWVVHTTQRLERIDITKVGRFPCTSASRTVIDLARSARRDELERAIDSAVRDGSSSPSFLRKRLASLRGSGRAGVRLLDELLVDAGGHSALERAFLALVRRAELPRPICQRVYRRDGKTVARVDFDFAPRPVVAEVSGQRGHASDPERAKDARRRNELQALGLVVLEFTYGDIERRSSYVLATLRRHLTGGLTGSVHVAEKRDSPSKSAT
jgi:very-short-patch-repair endonuclease